MDVQTDITRCTPKFLSFRLLDTFSGRTIAFIGRQCYFIPSVCLVEVPGQIRGFISNKLFTLCSHVTECKLAFTRQSFRNLDLEQSNVLNMG